MQDNQEDNGEVKALRVTGVAIILSAIFLIIAIVARVLLIDKISNCHKNGYAIAASGPCSSEATMLALLTPILALLFIFSIIFTFKTLSAMKKGLLQRKFVLPIGLLILDIGLALFLLISFIMAVGG